MSSGGWGGNQGSLKEDDEMIYIHSAGADLAFTAVSDASCTGFCIGNGFGFRPLQRRGEKRKTNQSHGRRAKTEAKRTPNRGQH